MSTYLVRDIHTKGILGLFWAPSLIELWRLVDAISDPSFYEVTPLKLGYLAFEGPVDPVPENLRATEDENVEAFSWSDASAGVDAFTALHCPEDVKWRRLPCANQPGSPYHKYYKAREASRA